jgi:hypothetical protein
MFRKLLILGAIAALFTIATVVPASALAVKNDQHGPKTAVPQFTDDGAFSNAHGPMCGVLPCPNNNSHAGAINPGGLSNPFGDVNVGAWNGVFQSNENSAICGISAYANEIPKALLDSTDPDDKALVAILLANVCPPVEPPA